MNLSERLALGNHLFFYGDVVEVDIHVMAGCVFEEESDNPNPYKPVNIHPKRLELIGFVSSGKSPHKSYRKGKHSVSKQPDGNWLFWINIDYVNCDIVKVNHIHEVENLVKFLGK